MIIIKVELWPKGDESKARILGLGTIANIGGSLTHGDYQVKLLKSPEYASAKNVGNVWRQGTVTNFPLQRLGPWDLMLRALAACVLRRNPGIELDGEITDSPLPDGED